MKKRRTTGGLLRQTPLLPIMTDFQISSANNGQTFKKFSHLFFAPPFVPPEQHLCGRRYHNFRATREV